MYLIYNILQILLIALCLPFIVVYVYSKEKYRNRIPSRLGIGLKKADHSQQNKPFTIWLHALSVGEVTSSVPLIQGLRSEYPESNIVVSVTTQSGREVANKVLDPLVNRIIDGPLDILPVVKKYYNSIHPDLYILVETDFWPNALSILHRNHVPIILVNGRVSDSAMAGYQRMRPFFRPMFNTLSLLFMQTEHDKQNMATLLGKSDHLHALGNLKYDTPMFSKFSKEEMIEKFCLPHDKIFFIAGSTHPGEEQILMRSYVEIRENHPCLHLLLAPRDHRRVGEVESLATQQGLTSCRRSSHQYEESDIFIIDTIGELIDFYSVSDIGFVGGSLVKKGGHNPIEPATMGLPVIFGPDMSDFREVAESLLEAEGAHRITGEESLSHVLTLLLDQPHLRDQQGKAACRCVQSQSGVVANHIQYIQQVL